MRVCNHAGICCMHEPVSRSDPPLAFAPRWPADVRDTNAGADASEEVVPVAASPSGSWTPSLFMV
eukprot:365644-Chlamydomonas_euryale.AAC.8